MDYWTPITEVVVCLTAFCVCCTFLVFSLVGYKQRSLPRNAYLLLINRCVLDLTLELLRIFLLSTKNVPMMLLSRTVMFYVTVFMSAHYITFHIVLLGSNALITGIKYFAIAKPLNYMTSVTTRRLSAILVLIWIVGILCGSTTIKAAMALECDTVNGTLSCSMPPWTIVPSRVASTVCYLLHFLFCFGLIYKLNQEQNRRKRGISLGGEEMSRNGGKTNDAQLLAEQQTRQRSLSPMLITWSILNYSIMTFPTFVWAIYTIVLVSDHDAVMSMLGKHWWDVMKWLTFIVNICNDLRIFIDYTLAFTFSGKLRRVFTTRQKKYQYRTTGTMRHSMASKTLGNNELVRTSLEPLDISDRSHLDVSPHGERRRTKSNGGQCNGKNQLSLQSSEIQLVKRAISGGVEVDNIEMDELLTSRTVETKVSTP